jgi:hypothetical protein
LKNSSEASWGKKRIFITTRGKIRRFSNVAVILIIVLIIIIIMGENSVWTKTQLALIFVAILLAVDEYVFG